MPLYTLAEAETAAGNATLIKYPNAGYGYIYDSARGVNQYILDFQVSPFVVSLQDEIVPLTLAADVVTAQNAADAAMADYDTGTSAEMLASSARQWGVTEAGESYGTHWWDDVLGAWVKVSEDIQVDQTYDPAGTGATSNVAVAEAVITRRFTTVATLLADTGSHAEGDTLEVPARGFAYTVAASGATDHHLTTAGGVKLYVIPDKGDFAVEAFGAVGDGVADDTAPIQLTINKAAQEYGAVRFGANTYLISTIYDHYDASYNPGFPQGNHREGRVYLKGVKAVDLGSLQIAIQGAGTLIKTSSATGPAILLGNGDGAGLTAARRTEVQDIAFMGTCTGAVVECDSIQQHARLENLTIFNNGGVGGKGLHIHTQFYSSIVRNLHISSTGTNGDGFVCEVAGMCAFELVNVTGCPGKGGVLGTAATIAGAVITPGFGNANHFTNCQFRNGGNGLEIKGGQSNTFTNIWMEGNTGEYDVKIHESASTTKLEGLYLTSTALTGASLVVGGNTGTSHTDAVRDLVCDNVSFHFCTANAPGVLKRGSCTSLELNQCSFKNNGGYGIKIDRTLGVTPTQLNNCDFFAVEAGSAIGSTSLVRDEANVNSPWLVRGLHQVGQISADLNMSTWTHLPDQLIASTTVNINITLPTNTTKLAGKTMMVRKSIAGNTLTLTGTINGVASITATALHSTTVVMAEAPDRWGQIN